MFPTLSVTVIGLIVGAMASLDRGPRWPAWIAGLVGAWVGFGLGAILGVTVDVLLATGVWVAIFGHVLAAVLAIAVVRWSAQRSATSTRR